MLGGAETTRELEFARAPAPPLFIITSIKAFPAAVLGGISRTIRLDWTMEQNREATALTVAVQE